MEINSFVKSWKIHDLPGSKHLIRLITGHHFLNSFQSKLNPSGISRNCSCGQVETLNHYLFLCQKYMRFRQSWIHKIVGVTEDLEDLNYVSLTTAFGQREDLSDKQNRALQESICKYIQDTGRFIWDIHTTHWSKNLEEFWKVSLTWDLRIPWGFDKRYVLISMRGCRDSVSAVKDITNNWISCCTRNLQTQNHIDTTQDKYLL